MAQKQQEIRLLPNFKNTLLTIMDRVYPNRQQIEI